MVGVEKKRLKKLMKNTVGRYMKKGFLGFTCQVAANLNHTQQLPSRLRIGEFFNP